MPGAAGAPETGEPMPSPFDVVAFDNQLAAGHADPRDRTTATILEQWDAAEQAVGVGQHRCQRALLRAQYSTEAISRPAHRKLAAVAQRFAQKVIQPPLSLHLDL